MQDVDNLLKKTSLCGEITIFLSFTLILVLALLGTILESARLSTAQCKADRILDNSMNYVFTQYCRPLWKDYHLLFLEGDKSERLIKERIAYSLEDCESYSLDNISSHLNSYGLNLLSLNKLKTEIENIIYAGDLKGEVFGQQVTEYMKYQLKEKEEKERKGMIEDISQLNHAFDVVEKQLEAEKQMGKWNQLMLQIIRNIEGISVGKNGIHKTWYGKVKTEKVFIKQLCPAQLSSNTVGIYNNEIWNSLKGKYINPIKTLENLERKLHELDEARKEREKEEKKKEEINSKKDTPNIKNMSVFTFRDTEQNKLIKKTEQIIALINETKILFDKLKKEEQRIKPNMDEWAKVWNEKAEKMPSNQKKPILQEKKQLDILAKKELVSGNSMNNQIMGMKIYLEKNKKILQQLLSLKMLTWGDGEEEIKDNLRLIKSIKGEIKKYHVKELSFDYGNVKLSKEENPLEAIPHDISKGILPYVIDDMSKVSKKKKEIRHDSLIKETIIDKPFDRHNIESELDKINESNKMFQGSLWIKKGLEKQLNNITMSEYIKNHFSIYGNSENIKETVLDYEQEYVIAGKSSDEENIEAVARRLILIRAMFNYLYLLTDKEAVNKAYVTAQGTVGLTCLEPLVLLTKQFILFIWAAEEGVIDTAELLSGKEIPLWKQKNSFKMEFKDIFKFNKSFVKKKVREHSKNNNGLCLKYEDYLSLLLQFSKRELILSRVMEEIEDNIRCRYDKNFNLFNCIYGFQVFEEYYLCKKFLQLPFVSVMLDDSVLGWRIKKSKIQCY